MTRDSPDHKPETGSESCSGKHNPLVRGSTPRGPTTAELPWPRTKALPSMRGIPFPVPIAWPGRHVVRKLARHRSRDPSNPPATPSPGKSKGSALDLTLTGSGFAVGSGSSRPERMRARAATSRWSPPTSTARCPPCHEPPWCLAQLHHCAACARVGCKITLVQVARK